jgi:ribonucleoside-diphosphate reductase beta chain
MTAKRNQRVQPAAPHKEPTMSAQPERTQHILEPGFELTLRPMRYPAFYEMYKNAIKNTWTVDEVDFSLDTTDLRSKMSDADRHRSIAWSRSSPPATPSWRTTWC